MYPLLLKAPTKDYFWGGNRLVTEFGFEGNGPITAEAWVLACHKDGTSVVENGPYAGKRLDWVLEQWGPQALGANGAAFSYFPLLIKFIDARDQLSIQVHPDNAYALEYEGEYGKTEMWYVVDCEPGAHLIYGFQKDITKDEFRSRIQNNTVTEVVNSVPVHKGDLFFIPAGTMHAIGAGILIAEVQQNSNTTYRISDFGRLGQDGKPRTLHVDKAVDVTDTSRSEICLERETAFSVIPGGRVRSLASCPFFTAEIMQVQEMVRVGREDSFVSLVCLDGTAVLETEDAASLSLKKGSSVFIPAGMTVRIQGSGEFLCSRV